MKLGEWTRRGIAAAALATAACSGTEISTVTSSTKPNTNTIICANVPGIDIEVYKCPSATVKVTQKTQDFVMADITITRPDIPETGLTTHVGVKLNGDSEIGQTVRSGDDTIVALKSPGDKLNNGFRPREITYQPVRRIIELISGTDPIGYICTKTSANQTQNGAIVSLYNCTSGYSVVTRRIKSQSDILEASIEPSDGVNPRGSRVREILASNQVLHSYFPDKIVDVYFRDGAVDVYYAKKSN